MSRYDFANKFKKRAFDYSQPCCVEAVSGGLAIFFKHLICHDNEWSGLKNIKTVWVSNERL